ncbi:MAG: hypothetical protein P8Y71_27670 [Pseudolabrys sp.]
MKPETADELISMVRDRRRACPAPPDWTEDALAGLRTLRDGQASDLQKTASGKRFHFAPADFCWLVGPVGRAHQLDLPKAELRAVYAAWLALRQPGVRCRSASWKDTTQKAVEEAFRRFRRQRIARFCPELANLLRGVSFGEDGALVLLGDPLLDAVLTDDDLALDARDQE